MEYHFDEDNWKRYSFSKKNIEKRLDELKSQTFIHKKKTFYTFNLSFDIETTSLYHRDNSKIIPDAAFMYVWMIGLDGECYFGRTWEEFKDFVKLLQSKLELNETNKVICFVHNLSFEFQFIHKLFKWDDVFFNGKGRNILKAETGGFIFRDSLIYSGESLKKVGENLLKYKCEKLKGDLDYSLTRTSKTELTVQESKYCIHDVIILNNYEQEEKELHGFDYLIDCLTKTSKVRKYIREHMFFDMEQIEAFRKEMMNNEDFKKLDEKQQQMLLDKVWNIKEFRFDLTRKNVQSQKMTSNDYRILNRCYAGGHTHANRLHSRKTHNHVHSFDFTSSYPYCLFLKYPVDSFTEIPQITKEQFMFYMQNMDDWGCLFDIEIHNVFSLGRGDNIISESKCWNKLNKEKTLIDNGRVVYSDCILTTMNEIDFYNFSRFYSFDSFTIKNFRFSRKSFLPQKFIDCVLHFYEMKTQYKHKKGFEAEYDYFKSLLNSIYGCLVQDLIHQEDGFDIKTNTYKETFKKDSFNINQDELDEIVSHYNKDKKRFGFYSTGIWCTSYSRKNLYDGILEFGNDYIYSDTDSLKVLNAEKHLDFINRYNEQVVKNIQECCKFNNLDWNRSHPCDVDGVEHQLGVWDWETKGNEYIQFKCLGAKRYIYTQKNKKGEIELHITVAGLSKSEGAKYLSREFDENGKQRTVEDWFEDFDDSLEVPEEYTGKLTHYYLDDRIEMDVKDYQGKTDHIISESGVCLTPCSFTMSMSKEYLELILNGYQLPSDFNASGLSIR